MAITRSKQSWQIGETVKVRLRHRPGSRKTDPDPGDYAPDAYVLWQSATNRFYQFVPHKGLARCANLQDALTV